MKFRYVMVCFALLTLPVSALAESLALNNPVRLWGPQIVFSPEYTNRVSVISNSRVVKSVAIRVHRSPADKLFKYANYIVFRVGQEALDRDQAVFTLEPFEELKLVLSTTSLKKEEGWLELIQVEGPDQAIVGYLSREITTNGHTMKFAGPLVTMAETTSFDAEWSERALTAIAITNPAYLPWEDASVTVRAVDDAGVVVGLTEITLNNGTQVALFLGEVFSENLGWAGYLAGGRSFHGRIEIESPFVPVAAVGVVVW